MPRSSAAVGCAVATFDLSKSEKKYWYLDIEKIKRIKMAARNFSK